LRFLNHELSERNQVYYWVTSTKLRGNKQQPTGCCPAQVGFQAVRRLAAGRVRVRVQRTPPASAPFPFPPRSHHSLLPVPSLVVRLRRSPSSSAARRQDGEALDPAGGQPGRHEPGELARPAPPRPPPPPPAPAAC
jgi:hypothetical protein